MGLVVNTNIAAMIAHRNLVNNTRSVSESLERLSTGYRINHAKDDVAGLKISEILRTQIRGYTMAERNAEDGASMLQVAEGAFETITENIQRIRELVVQAANDTYGSNEKNAIAQEIWARTQDIDRIANTCSFNSIKLLDGTQTHFVLQIGPNGTSNDTISLSAALQTATASALGLSYAQSDITASAGGFLESNGSCQTFLSQIDSALTTMFTRRSTIGALQNRLDSVISNIEITKENLSASESRIRDLDIAAETTRLTKNQVLQQASVSILAQANQIPALALNLL